MSTEQILSSDGIPLEISLKKAERRNKIRAVLLVAPLFLFILIIYVFPIGEMLFRSIDDRKISGMLPKTFTAMENGMLRIYQKNQFIKHFMKICHI